MTAILAKIRIVLIRTSHPGNIGATARAMKTMGLEKLYLVQPKHFPSAEAIAMASNADDILEQAVVVDSLPEALADCQLVFGTSSRRRYLSWPNITARAAGEQVIDATNTGQEIAIVFGNERTGMTNAELQQCHYHTHIPTNPDYASLNLAQAVQVLCYECRVAFESVAQKTPAKQPKDKERLATQAEMNGLYEHLESALQHLRFIHPQQQTPPMARLQRLFQRAQCTDTEVHILRGICKKMLK